MPDGFVFVCQLNIQNDIASVTNSGTDPGPIGYRSPVLLDSPLVVVAHVWCPMSVSDDIEMSLILALASLR
jgi:hypothetical protein